MAAVQVRNEITHHAETSAKDRDDGGVLGQLEARARRNRRVDVNLFDRQVFGGLVAATGASGPGEEGRV